MSQRLFVLIAVMVFTVIVEWYFIQALKTITIDYTPTKRKIILYVAYAIALLSIGLGTLALFYPPPNWNNFWRFIMGITMILFVSKILCFIVLFIEDISRGLRWIYNKYSQSSTNTEVTTEVSTGISRIKFLSYLGATLTLIPAFSFIYGMVRGAYKYKVHKVKVKAPNLPEAFHGFKIVQLSDMHSGSFFSNTPLQTAFNLVLEQKPDIIFLQVI